MKAYLMRLICAAILCALVEALAGNGPGSGIRKLTAGIFLTLTAFSLPGNFELPEFDTNAIFSDARAAASEGVDQAEAARADIIIEACEAYVESKAAALGLELSVRVELDDQQQPCRAELTGAASPEERRELLAALEELGLGEEDVIWTLSYQSSA